MVGSLLLRRSLHFDATNRAVVGDYNFIGVVEHEISEVLGRGFGLGTIGGNGSSLTTSSALPVAASAVSIPLTAAFISPWTMA